MARSAKFCLLSAWKWCHLWPPCMHFVATKCVRLCTCIIGIKFCEQQQPHAQAHVQLKHSHDASRPLHTMGVKLFLQEHSQLPLYSYIYCRKFMLRTLLHTIMNKKSCENAIDGYKWKKSTNWVFSFMWNLYLIENMFRHCWPLQFKAQSKTGHNHNKWQLL